MMNRFKLLAVATLLSLSVAACDEGTVVAPVANGSVTGTVTVDAAGQAGVTVTLQPGAKTATTAANGTYTISDVAAGAYTVTITGAPADAAFPSTTQGAVIATAGQAVTVNFAGTRIRNSTIAGSVTNAGVGVAGVAVTIAGPDPKTATTDANGTYAVTGLRAGAYTVTIAAPANSTCTPASNAVTLAAGESKVASFACASAATARISGVMFLDENNKNDLYDGAALEDGLAAANVAITIEGPTIGVTRTVQTDANGAYTVTGLTAGSYNVTIASADPDLPAGVAFGGTNPINVTITAGGSATVNFPFDITRQTIMVYAFLGRDASPAPAGISTSIPTGVAPQAGVILDLYPTEADALASTNRLGRDTTDAAGGASFNFLRTADTSPGGTVQDQIVFAQFVGTTAAQTLLTLNGETRVEVKYNPRSATGMAADTFDLLSSLVQMKMMAVGGTAAVAGAPLAGWSTALWLNDTTATARKTGVTDATGTQFWIDTIGPTALPDTFFMRLSGTQAAAGTHAFTQTPVAVRGTTAGAMLRWIFNGTTLRADTVYVGDERVLFRDADLVARVYHERDDSIPGGPPKYTAGDNIENADNIQMELRWRQTGAATDSVRTVTAAAVDGTVSFLNVPVNMGPYTMKARSLVANQVVLNDTSMVVATGGNLGDLSGTVLTSRVYPLGANTTAGHAAFAFKYNNTSITGRVKAADSTAAVGIIVTMAPTAQSVQGTASRSDTTDANGLFSFAGMREGPYTVSVAGNAIWQVVTPSSGSISVDMENNGDNDILNFIMRRLDTAIHGVVVNDRDQDTNTVDAGEALVGVTIQLYRDGSGAVATLDTLHATTTTNASGAYSFTNLPEGRYVVKAVSPATATVLRGYDGAAMTVRDTSYVTTAAAVANRTIGTVNPVPLPRWDYATSTVFFDGRTNFTFLVTGNVATGQVTANPGGAAISGALVNLRRCNTSAGAVSPPAAGACTTYFPGLPVQATTDPTGFFTYANLLEGVYEIMPVTPSTPASRLFLLMRNGESPDNERGDFTTP